MEMSLMTGAESIWRTHLCGITDLLNNIVDFIDGQINDLLLHPCRLLEFLDELVLDV